MCEVIQDAEARSIENLSATENCISAIGKICRYRGDSVNTDEILPHWLSWLPIWDDEDEVLHVYNYLADLIEQ